MVKKIRVIEETPDELETGDNRALMDMAKTMDWKLWEILQIMQRLEKSLKNAELTVPEHTFGDEDEVQPEDDVI
jgi:hypothetical protein